ncbi:hypothetical protein [Kribbella sp. NPDC055071]
MTLGLPRLDGQLARDYTATKPVNIAPGHFTRELYPTDQVRLSTTFTAAPKAVGESRSGLVVMGDVLYSSAYATNANYEVDRTQPVTLTRIGPGWSKFRSIDLSVHQPVDPKQPSRSTLYAFRTDGVLMRWQRSKASWVSTGSVGGLSTVKSMALIGRSYTYDTFLANTRAGALITIRIPTTSPLKPVVTTVRASGWQDFETLLAARCGKSGEVLFALDNQTQRGQMYAVGHASGTTTVIKGIGPADLGDDWRLPFRWAPANDTLTGA